MAQNITLLGANYPDVPAVQLPITGGGTASFVDTSDATASASTILNGFTAYVNGSLVTGIASGGGSSVVIGTITPAANARSITISAIVGKNNVIVIPASDITDMTKRVHYGCIFLDGRCVLIGSTNSGKTVWTFTSTLSMGTGQTGTKDELDTGTGTITIKAGAGSNSGGYFQGGTTYRYLAW